MHTWLTWIGKDNGGTDDLPKDLGACLGVLARRPCQAAAIAAVNCFLVDRTTHVSWVVICMLRADLLQPRGNHGGAIRRYYISFGRVIESVEPLKK